MTVGPDDYSATQRCFRSAITGRQCELPLGHEGDHQATVPLWEGRQQVGSRTVRWSDADTDAAIRRHASRFD